MEKRFDMAMILIFIFIFLAIITVFFVGYYGTKEVFETNSTCDIGIYTTKIDFCWKWHRTEILNPDGGKIIVGDFDEIK